MLTAPPFPQEGVEKTVAKIDQIKVRNVLDSNDVPTGRTTQYVTLTFKDRLGERSTVETSVSEAFLSSHNEGDALTIFYNPSNLEEVNFEGKSPPMADLLIAFILAIVAAPVLFFAFSFFPWHRTGPSKKA